MSWWGWAVLAVACLAGCSGDDDGGAPDARRGVVDATPIDTDAGLECTIDINCIVPGGGNASFCGRLYDAETGDPIAKPGAHGARCDPAMPELTGPCSVEIAFYGVSALVENPLGPPLDADEIMVDDCGRFRGVNVTRPGNGFIAVTTGPLIGDLSVATGNWVVTEIGQTERNMEATVTRKTTDEMWTVTAGNPFGGPTFSEKGVMLARYTYAGTPVSGVVVTSGGALKPDDDFYFNDTDPGVRSSIDPAQPSTGANGTALLVNTNLGQHSGIGAEPAECEWLTEVSFSIPGFILVSRFPAHETGDPEMACP